jgi:CheY-like chemotaxis protein
VLLDWNLPKVTGREVLRRSKEHENLRKIPILVFSASADAIDIHNAYRNHANGYLMKPVDPELLAELVGTIEQFWTTAKIPRVFREPK